ncbi:MAG TPA: TPM domain-containing protein [Clostridia bacterium]|nr:TPM domain-containing protein [Clostridia bacterium]
MKRIIPLFLSVLFLILVMLLPVKAAEFDLVLDEVGLLADYEYIELNDLAMDITEKYQCEVSIVIIDDLEDNDASEFAKFVYEEYDYGYGGDKSGLMFLMATEDRDCTLIANGYGNTAFTDHGKGVLLDRHILPMLRQDKYYDGFLIYLNQTAEFLEMAKQGRPFDMDTDEILAQENAKSSFWIKLAITILVPLLIAAVVCFIFLGQMKTAVPQRAADEYIAHEGLNLTRQVDAFLYSTETRRRIEEKSSSGGASVGSDGFSSSKGKF